MVCYPLERLAAGGVKDVLIITGPEQVGHFLRILRSGKAFGVRVSYEMQEEAGGIAQALAIFAVARDDVLGEKGEKTKSKIKSQNVKS